MEMFFDIRLDYYEKRKAYLAAKLTEEWEKLDNKVRFILAVVHGELVVSNRKKADILAELRDEGYKTFFPVKKNAQAGGAVAAEDEEGEESPDEAEPLKLDRGYDYLLSMKLWSLTMEKVQELCKERDNKRDLLDTLLAKAGHHLWLEDLDALEDALDMFEEAIVLEEEEERKAVRKATKAGNKSRGGNAGAKKTTVKRGKQRGHNHSDDSDEEDFGDDDSDYEATIKPKAKPRAALKTTTSSAPPRAKTSTAAVKVPVEKVTAPAPTPMEIVEEDLSKLTLLDRMKKRMQQKEAAAAPKSIESKAKAVVDLRDDSDEDAYQPEKEQESSARRAVSRPARAAVSRPKVYAVDSEDDEDLLSDSASEGSVSDSESDFESDDMPTTKKSTKAPVAKVKQSVVQKKLQDAPIPAPTVAKSKKRVAKGNPANVTSPAKQAASYTAANVMFSPGIATPPDTKKARKQNVPAVDRILSLVQEDELPAKKGPGKKASTAAKKVTAPRKAATTAPKAKKAAPAPKKSTKRVMDSDDENDDDEFTLEEEVTVTESQKPARSTRKIVKSYVFDDESDEEESDFSEADDESDFSN